MRLINYKIKKMKGTNFSKYLSLSMPRVETGPLNAVWPRMKQSMFPGKEKLCVIAGGTAYTRFKERIADPDIQSFALVSECCNEGVSELTAMIQKSCPDYLIAVGGGKCLDTAKLLKQRLNIPLVLIPSSAATCAAFSPVSIVYSPQHEFREVVNLSRTADMVLLDMDFIMSSPARLLSAGIGDTLAKWLEAKAVLCSVSSQDDKAAKIEVDCEANAQAGFEIARQAYDTVVSMGEKAVTDHQQKNKSKEWEETVLASIILNGMASFLGGDDYPAAFAHSFANGLTVLPSAKGLFHGEAVGLGLLVQAELIERYTGQPVDLKQELVSYYKKVGLPVCLRDTEIKEIKEEELGKLTNKIFAVNESLNALPFKLLRQDVLNALEVIK